MKVCNLSGIKETHRAEDLRWKQHFSNYLRALQLNHPDLREHIERIGVVLYERAPR